jgi:Flp pilus assembly protein TadD
MTQVFRPRRWIFLATLAMLVGGLLAGLVASWRFNSRLPRIELDYGWYLQELQARGDIESFAHGMQVAMDIDDGLDPVAGEKLLGGAYANKKSYVEAIQHYKRAAEKNPTDAEALLLLGTTLLQQNRIQEAIPYLTQARDLQPDNPAIRLNLGLSLARDEKLAAAIAEFQVLVQLQPGNAQNHGILALTLHGAGRTEEATLHCQEALRLEPQNAQLRGQCESFMSTSTP